MLQYLENRYNRMVSLNMTRSARRTSEGFCDSTYLGAVKLVPMKFVAENMIDDYNYIFSDDEQQVVIFESRKGDLVAVDEVEFDKYN